MARRRRGALVTSEGVYVVARTKGVLVVVCARTTSVAVGRSTVFESSAVGSRTKLAIGSEIRAKVLNRTVPRVPPPSADVPADASVREAPVASVAPEPRSLSKNVEMLSLDATAVSAFAIPASVGDTASLVASVVPRTSWRTR